MKKTKSGRKRKNRERPHASDYRQLKKYIRNDVEKACKKAERKDVTSSKYDTPRNVMKREVYAFIKGLIDEGCYSNFLRQVKGMGNLWSDRSIENPFNVGFLYLFPDPSHPYHKSRTKYAIELIYAYDHDIAPDELIAFVYLAGGYKKIRDKRKQGAHEKRYKARPLYSLRQ